MRMDAQMQNQSIQNIEVVKFHNPKDREEVLTVLSEVLVSKEWAKEGLPLAVVEREKSFPTGLHTSEMDVAIPHADAEWTLEPAIAIGVLDRPVTFLAMDGSKKNLEPKLVFLLAIPDGKAHISLLQGLTKIFKNPKDLPLLHGNPSKSTFQDLLTKALEEQKK
jgi:PTS system galactitol-specific IIA component